VNKDAHFWGLLAEVHGQKFGGWELISWPEQNSCLCNYGSSWWAYSLVHGTLDMQVTSSTVSPTVLLSTALARRIAQFCLLLSSIIIGSTIASCEVHRNTMWCIGHMGLWFSWSCSFGWCLAEGRGIGEQYTWPLSPGLYLHLLVVVQHVRTAQMWIMQFQVLATDMSKHLDHLAHLKTMVETHRLSGGNTTLLLCDVSERLQVCKTTRICQATCPVLLLRMTDHSAITSWGLQ